MSEEQFIVDSGERETNENGGTREPDDAKTDWTFLPFDILDEVADHLKASANLKYERDNWKLLNTRKDSNRFIRSAFRHLIDFTIGKKNENHLAACICNILFYLWHRRYTFGKES